MTLFIAGNKLQTLFGKHIPEVSLKQFMLLSIARQAEEQLTFTQLGNLLGNDFFQNDFLTHQKELEYLFEVYTEQEIETLFTLLSKLYAGIEHLERKEA